MSRLLLLSALITAGLAGGSLQAAEPARVRAEIETLLLRLQGSTCRFNRNGTWYSGEQASRHLTRKLNYLTARQPLNSSEQFIELGASASSFSGKPYRVQCDDQPAVTSSHWLLTQLRAIRRQ